MIPATSSVIDQYFAFVHGERWRGLATSTFTDYTTGVAPIVGTLTSMTLEFRPKGSRTILLTLSSPADITIVSSAAWSFSIAARLMPELLAGEYDYRLKAISSDSVTPQSYIDGVLVVLSSFP